MWDRIRRAVAGLQPRTVLLVAWVFLIVYAYPGYMNFDSGEQILQARNGRFTDWHPPLMARYWRVIEYVIRGPFGMLLLQSCLFTWGLYAVLRQRFEARTAAWLAAAVLLFPPVFTPMAMVWKDAQMAAFLIAGLALALGRARWMRVLGVVLFVFASGVRDNGAAALPFLGLWIAHRWGVRRPILVALAAFALFVGVAGAARQTNQLLTRFHEYPWYNSIVIMDIAGTIVHERPMTDEELRPLVEGTGIVKTTDIQNGFREVYTPRKWFAVTWTDEGKEMYHQGSTRAERTARKRAWRQLVTEHTGAYLAHRWAVMRELLGLSDDYIWEPVGQTFAANQNQLDRVSHAATMSSIQSGVGGFYREKLVKWLYKAWAYALLSVVFLGWAVWRRDLMIAALCGSGLLYEASFFVGTAAPDWRYSHWMVTCCVLSAVIILVERVRAGRRRTEPVGPAAAV